MLGQTIIHRAKTHIASYIYMSVHDQETLNQRCFNIGLHSLTPEQHYSSIAFFPWGEHVVCIGLGIFGEVLIERRFTSRHCNISNGFTCIDILFVQDRKAKTMTRTRRMY